MIEFVTERLMELTVAELTGTTDGERSPDQLVQRNSYRERDWRAKNRTRPKPHSRAS